MKAGTIHREWVTLGLWISNSVVALAEEDKKEAVIYLKAICSEGIEIKEGDIFEITYKLVDGKDSAKIIVDAYDILDEKMEIVLPLEDCEVINLEYKGNNPAIIEYAIVSAFCPFYRDKLPPNIILAIGTEEAEYLKRTYQDVLCINGINDHILIDENGEASFYEDRYEEQIKLEQEIIANGASMLTELEINAEDESYYDNIGIEESLPSDEAPINKEIYSNNLRNVYNWLSTFGSMLAIIWSIF